MIHAKEKILITLLLLALLPICAYGADKGNPPIAYWRFDESGGGTAYDDSANNNDGTLNAGGSGANTAVGQMWTRQGKIGGALECDGTNDYVSVGSMDAINGLSQLTISGWVKRNASNSYGALFFKEQSGSQWIEVVFHSSGLVYFVTSGVSVGYGSIPIPAGTNWNFYTCVFDGTQTGNANRMKIYLNGIQQTVSFTGGDVAATTASPTATAYIGCDLWNTKYLNGLIDDVRIYNYARTPAQILADYNAGSAVYTGSGTDVNEGNLPVGYWTFNENTGTTAYDRSGNGNNGTITGSAWAQGKYGTGLSFNGSSDYVTTTAPANLTTATVECWIKRGDTSTSQQGFIDATTFVLALETHKIDFIVPGVSNNYTTSTIIDTTAWHHIACVASSGSVKVYIDGVQDSASLTPAFSAGTLVAIGRRQTGSTQYFNGFIDDVKIYNYARTPTQIAYDYNKGKPVAHYRFDESGGTIVKNDYSSAGSGASPLFESKFNNSINDFLGDAGTFTPLFGYRALGPSNLTSKNGVLITQSDNLQYSRGSSATADGTNVNYENFDPNQGTLEFWVRPNWNGDDNLVHGIFYHYYNSTNIFRLFKQSNNRIYLYLKFNSDDYGNINSDVSSWTAGTWHHIIGVWDKNNITNGTDYRTIYIDGVRVAGNASAIGSSAGIGSIFYIGSEGGNSQFNGTIAGRILNRPLSSTEVTALYNSGAGSTDTFTVTPDTVWMGTYSESTTNAYQHQGKSVSAITDGASEDTLTTAAGADTSFKDNDRIVVSDGTGYKVEGFVDGTPSSTTMYIDDGAGGDAGLTEKVGVYASITDSPDKGLRKSSPTINYVDDLSITAWIKTTQAGVTWLNPIVECGGNVYWGFVLGTNTSGGISALIYRTDAENQYMRVNSVQTVNDNKWHFVSLVYDDAPTSQLSIYVDGILSSSSTSKSGTRPTSIPWIWIGDGHNGGLYNGSVRDVMVFTSALSDADILKLATNPLSENGLSPVSWWKFTDDASATTITDVATAGNNNHLAFYGGTTTNYGTHSRTQAAFVSKNLIADSGMENGGIGGWTGLSGVTMTKDASLVKYDGQAFKLTNSTSSSNECAMQTIKVASGEDYLFRGWAKSADGVNIGGFNIRKGSDSSYLVNYGITTQSTNWTEVESSFQIPDGETTIQFRAFSVSTNGKITYFDQVQILPNLVDNGGMEGVSDPPSGWTQETSATVVSDASNYHSGPSSAPTAKGMKVTAGAANVGARQTLSLIQNKYYTLTFWAKANTGKTIYCAIWNGSAWITPANGISTTSWTKYQYTFKAAAANTLYLRGSASGDEGWFDDVAIVELDSLAASTATPSTTANSYGTGRDGTTSGAILVDGKDTLTYSGTGNINTTQGTVSMWIKPLYPWTLALNTDRRFWGSDTNTRMRLVYQSGRIKFDNPGGGWTGTAQSALMDLSANTWYHITATWNSASGSQVYVNGSAGTANTNSYTAGAVGLIEFGDPGDPNQNYVPDAFYDDVRIYDYVRTAEQIYNDYKTTQGNMVGDTKFVDGKIGKALQFDGSGDYVLLPNSSNLNLTSATWEAWVKPAATDTRCITGRWGPGSTDQGWLFGFDASSKLYLETPNNVYYASNSNISSNIWSHAAVTADGSNVKFYINGNLDRTMSQTQAISNIDGEICIGNLSAAFQSWPYNGLIDDLRIYNYARTANEILKDYNLGASAKFGSGATYTLERDPWAGSAPIAQWKMDENTGALAYDASGNGNNGTLGGDGAGTDVPTWTQGKNGPCLSFDGTDDYVSTPSFALSGTVLTFSAWVKSSQQAQIQTIFSKGSQSTTIGYIWLWRWTSLDHLVWQYANGTTFVNGTIGNFFTGYNNTWVYITIVCDYDNKLIYFYRNGVLFGSAVAMTGTPVFPSTTQVGNIGSYGAGSSNLFNGLIDDVRIYNYVRTPAQIAWDYNKGKPIGYWRFDERASGQAVDTTAGAIKDDMGTNNATASNTTWTYTSGKYARCLGFDGNDYVETTSRPITGTNNFTISAWINFNRLSSTYEVPIWNGIDSTTAGFGIGYRKPNSRIIYAGWGSSTGEVTGPAATDGVWYHVASTYNGTTHYFYVNGKSQGSADYALSNFTSGLAHFGNLTQASAYWFSGKIDDVRIYNYARTAEQIAQDYNQGSAARLGD